MPFMPAPDPTGLPAPIWILKLLSVLTLTLHLIAMNLLVGGLLVLALTYRRRQTDQAAARLNALLARLLPTVMSLTITLGVAPLLFVQVIYGQAFYSSSILMVWPWLTIVPLVMAAYYGLYACQFRPDWLGARVTIVAWLSAVTVLVVGLLFSSNWTLMLTPKVWGQVYQSASNGFHLNLGDPTMLPRYFHAMVGAAMVAGLGIALIGRRIARDETEIGGSIEKLGRRWFLAAGGLQVLVGSWLLMALPRNVLTAYMGRVMPDTSALGVGILLALIAMVVVRRTPVFAAVLTGLSMFAMVAVRHRVRQMMLMGDLDVNRLAVHPQWALLGLFVVVFLLGIATAVWLVASFMRAKPAS